MKKWGALALGGLIILLQPGFIYGVFGIFAVIWIFNLRAPQRFTHGSTGLFFTLWAVGLIVELGAWGDDYRLGEWSASLHPQLLWGLLAGLGLYGAWALGWAIVLTRYRFSPAQIFWLAAVIGIAVEQQGAIFIAGLMSMPLGLYLWAITAMVYGASVLGPYLLWQNHLHPVSHSKWRWLIAAAIVFTIGTVTGIIWDVIFPLPPHQPIRLHPFI